MPNIFAYLVLLSSPIAAVVLFRLLPLERALVWTIIGFHLFLPSSTQIKFPMIPAIDRALVPALSAFVLCALMSPRMTLTLDGFSRTGRQVLFILFGLVVVTPIITVLHNTEPIIDGRIFLPGLRLYDAWGLISVILVAMIPLWLGIRYLNNPAGHRAILEIIAIAGLVYTIPALVEIRLSPQLHTWVYGFFPSDFIQHMRGDGFRPTVFLNHGLMLGIFFCMSIISAAVLYREARREGKKAFFWLATAIWVTFVLFLSKSLGAFVLAILFGGSVFLFGRRVQVWIGVTVAVIVLLYPMLRGAGWIPVDTVHDLALMVSEERAASLKFRLDNEDALLDKANLKPVAGWGSWGRNALYDPETGEMTSITDGIWLIFIGVYGWLGYIGRFGLLTVPIILYALRHKSMGPSYITPGLIMVLAALLVDLLPNAGLVNYVWLMAGAVAGIVVWRPAGAPDPASADAATGGTYAVQGGFRASWLMADETAPSSGRQKRSELRGSSR